MIGIIILISKTAKNEDFKKILILSTNYLGEDDLCALGLSIIQNKVDFLDLFVKYGGDPKLVLQGDFYDGFDLACKYGSLDVVKYFLEKKIYSTFGPQDEFGNTLLHKAASGDSECFKFILSKSAFVNTTNPNTGFSPIFMAILSRNIENVKLLLEKNVDLKAKEKNKRTPLHYASSILPYATSVEIGRLLLSKPEKVDINAVDIEGYNPYDIASLQGNNEFCDMLLEYGAVPYLLPSSSKNINPIKSRRLYNKGDVPEARMCPSSVVIGDYLYFGGGLIGDNANRESDLYRCSISNIQNDWIIPLSNLTFKKGIKFNDIKPELATIEYGETTRIVSKRVKDDLEYNVSIVGKDAYSKLDGVAYYEVLIDTEPECESPIVSVGYLIADSDIPEHVHPGWIEGSFGFHSDTGTILIGPEMTHEESWDDIPANKGDILGIGYIFERNEIFYTMNGKFLGTLPYPIDEEFSLLPFIGLGSGYTIAHVNFGERPFKFDFTAPTISWEKVYEFTSPIQAMFKHPSIEDGLLVVSEDMKNYYTFNVNSKEISTTETTPLKEGFVPHADNQSYLVDNKVFILVKLELALEQPKKRKTPFLYCLDLSTNTWSDWFASGNAKFLMGLVKNSKDQDFTGFADEKNFYIVQPNKLNKVEKTSINEIKLNGAGPSKDINIHNSTNNLALCLHNAASLLSIPLLLETSSKSWYLPHILGHFPMPREGSSLTFSKSNNSFYISHGVSQVYTSYVDLVDEVKLDQKDEGENLVAAFNSEAVSDFLIKTASKEFRVAKVILSSRSKYFNEFFANSENEGKESLDMTDEKDVFVEALLKYFYTNLIDCSLVTYNDLKEFNSFVEKYAPNQLKRIRALLGQFRVTLPSTMSQDLIEGFQSKFSDIQFVTEGGNESIYAHKAILIGRNPTLYSMIGESGKYELEGVKNHEVAKEIIKQSYEGSNYTIPHTFGVEELKEFLVATKKYSPSLINSATLNLFAKVNKENCENVLKFAEANNLELLSNAINSFKSR